MDRDPCAERFDAGLKRSLLRLVIVVLILIVMAGSGMALWLTRYDSGQLRVQLTDVLSESTGYRIRIGGPLKLRLFPLPGLKASGVTLQSPKQPEPPLATADTVSISIDWFKSVLQRDLVLGQASLDGVRVELVRDSEGVANWSPNDPAQPPPDETEPSDPGIPSFLPHSLKVTSLEFSFNDQLAGQKFDIRIPAGQISHRSPGASLEFQLDALIRHESLQVSGTLAWPSPKNSKLFQFAGNLELSTGDAQLKVEGGSPRLNLIEGLNLRFDFSSSQPETLIRRWIGPGSFPWLELMGGFDLSGHLIGQPDGTLSIQDATLQMDQPSSLRLAISGNIHNLKTTRDLELDIEASTPALSKAIRLIEPTLGPVGRTRLTAQIRGPAEAPKAQDIDVQIEAEQGVTVTLKGDLDHSQQEWDGGVDFTIKATETNRLVNFVAELAGQRAGPLGPLRDQINQIQIGQKFLTLKPLAVSGRLHGKGSNWQLSHFEGHAGTPPGDHLSASGAIASLWPEPSGYEFKAQTRIHVPGPLPGFADNRIEEIHAQATYRRKDSNDWGRVDDIAFEITGEAGAHLKGKGSLTLAERAGLDFGHLDLEMTAPSLHPLARLGQFSLPDWGPVHLAGHVEGDLKRMNFALHQGRIGDTHLTGLGSFDRALPAPTVHLKLDADALHIKALRELTDAAGSQTVLPHAGKQEAASSDAPSTDADLLLDEPRLAWLKETGGQVELSVGEFFLEPHWSLKGLHVVLDWGNGMLRGPTGYSQKDARGSQIDFKSSIDSRASPPQLALGFRGNALPIAPLVKWLGYPGAASGDFLLVIDLQSEGVTRSELISHLDGSLLLDAEKGTVASEYVDQISVDIIPTHQKAEVPMECLITYLTADQGVLRSEAFLWKSGPAQLRGAGVVDWPKRKVDIVLRPHLKKFLAPKVTAAIRIKGPLDAPRIMPEPLQTATDLVRGVLGRTLGLVSKVSPQLSKAVTQIGGETDKVLSASGIDNKLLLSLLASPVDCQTLRSDQAIHQLSEYQPRKPGTQALERKPDR